MICALGEFLGCYLSAPFYFDGLEQPFSSIKKV